MTEETKDRKPRRGKGEGSIFQRKDGPWVAVMTTGINPKNGRLKRVYFYGKTKTEARQKLKKALVSKEDGVFTEPSKMTVQAWLDKWLYQRKRGSLKPTSWDSYKYLIDVHINPAIGHIKLKSLTLTHLNDLYNAKREKGRTDGKGALSGRTVRYIHAIIRNALADAVREKIIAVNVAADGANLPRQEKKEIRVLTPEEQGKFLAACENDRLYVAFLLNLTSGLRVGELLALRWQDIDLEEGAVRIRRTMVKIRNQEGKTKTKLIFQEPKSGQGMRDIPIPPDVAAELKAYKAKQNQERLLLGEAYRNNDLVFCTGEGKPLEPRNFTRKFHDLIEKAGIAHANLHALRHTYATRLLEANEHPKVVQELLGHSQISMTLDTYSHVSTDLKKNAAAKLTGLARKASKLPPAANNKA